MATMFAIKTMKLSVNLATGNPEHFLQDKVLFEFPLCLYKRLTTQ